MNSNQIRQTFFDFFKARGHKIVPSAPIVVKDDPTLMFTNAGMNQFKDLFLGNKKAEFTRIADTQKCLRVSGKHNDLEEVGVDTYHHTMFEMLGNWSIGDYFKAEAIAWSWELLTQVYKLDKSRLYVTVFEGDAKENLPPSSIALEEWKKHVSEDHILFGNKKDNFWEMGDTGPCGPCTEIHFDNRSDEERNIVPGKDLVNNDHPQVIEIWNNVFIQYNRKADGSLEPLPAKHVDTGMGFERLVRVIQAKNSNYDTDVFTPTIHEISRLTGKTYGFSDSKQDVAFRVLSDHIRAISFTIADGQLPSSNGAGYVIRRILRRAVRYYYTHLETKQPLLHLLLPIIANQFKDVFPELNEQQNFVQKVILEEEKSFLRTLEGGLKKFEDLTVVGSVLDGRSVFELYDTYGFPLDLTRLIASERGWTIDEAEFNLALKEQKERSRSDAKRETGDWTQVTEDSSTEFVGYDQSRVEDARIIKYRLIKHKDKEMFQVVLNKTCFYPEGGGQVGDVGLLMIGGEMVRVVDTKKENDLIIHFVEELPDILNGIVVAEIDVTKRRLTENNHSATHLLHAALRTVLGSHVQQKGSLVKDDHLRFDFAHFQKMSEEEIEKVEHIVNAKIRENIGLQEDRSIPIDEAKAAGAMMLFGEKYGDKVRMITFDPEFSRELCGGCHVKSTGTIGFFKLVSEGAIAAGVRRIEAITSVKAEAYIESHFKELQSIRALFKNNQHTVKNIVDVIDENKELKKEIERLMLAQATIIQQKLVQSAVQLKGLHFVKDILKGIDGKTAKMLAYNVLGELGSGIVVFGIDEGEKCQIMVAATEDITKSHGIHAGQIVKTLAPYIGGGGGGQAFFATAGGHGSEGLKKALDAVDQIILNTPQ